MASTSEARGAQVTAGGAPYRITERHIEPRRRTAAQVALWMILLAPLLAAIFGFLGGGPSERTTVRNPLAELSVDAQRIARSGNWFETVIVAVPRRDVADLTIAIDQPLWRRMSIDTLAPDAEKAEFKEGSFRYAFGPLRAGERFEMKLDGQLQSWGYRRLRGEVELLDGERPLASVPLTITVLP